MVYREVKHIPAMNLFGNTVFHETARLQKLLPNDAEIFCASHQPLQKTRLSTDAPVRMGIQGTVCSPPCADRAEPSGSETNIVAKKGFKRRHSFMFFNATLVTIRTGVLSYPHDRQEVDVGLGIDEPLPAKFWVQSWVQLEGLFQPKMARKLRQINESLIGYEPEEPSKVKRQNLRGSGSRCSRSETRQECGETFRHWSSGACGRRGCCEKEFISPRWPGGSGRIGNQ